MPDWIEYPLVLLLGAGVVWRLARNLLSFLGLVAFGCVVWVGISSAQAYADHGDPYLALLSGVDTLLEHVRQIWN
jgi:hypothetical protein